MQEAPVNEAPGLGRRIGPGLLVSADVEPDGRLAVRPDGLLKYDAAASLQAFFAEQLAASAASSAVLDCSRLTFVDSHGLALLLLLHRQCQTVGGKLALRGANMNLRSLLQLTRIDLLLSVE